jgi:glycosyltransferase involved in cell wall biosynthesis
VVNYRGGEAQTFLERSGAFVLKTLGNANALAVPSGFLQQVFARHGLHSDIVPNIVDIERFRPGADAQELTPHLVIARSLEPIYDIGTALRAFALVRGEWPQAKLTIAGSGPELAKLSSLARELGISDAVNFCGRLTREQMAELYRGASVFVNPSLVDNMPNSVLEAMASGVPVVTTDAGGVPFIVRQGVTGLMVPAGDPAAMAAALRRVLSDRGCAYRLREAALTEVQRYTWPRIKGQWTKLYGAVLARPREAG